jgi:prophage regulatory protein
MNHVDFNRLPDDALIRLTLLISWGLIPFSPSTLWRKVRAGEFPAPVKVSAGVTAWRVGELRSWQRSPSNFNASGIRKRTAGGQS